MALPPAAVDPEVYSLALSLTRAINLERVGFIQVQSANCVTMPASSQLVEDGEVHDIADRSAHSEPTRQPSATISLSGVNYGEYGTNVNVFHISFGVYPAEDGTRILECTPRESDSLAYFYEFHGARQATAELFPDEAQANPRMYEEARRIRLGTFSPSGEFTADRPFNEHAFDTDILAVLNQISGPQAPDANFTINQEHTTIDQR